MELLKRFNFKDLPHDLILDGSESFYSKVTNACGLPIRVGYPYPIEAPSRKIDEFKLKQFFQYSSGNKRTNQARREFGRMKNEILDQDFKNHAVLPQFLINYINDDVKEEINYGFNIPYSYGVLEKFYDDNELCLLRPNIDNNLEVFRTRKPKEKIILHWGCPDPIRSLKKMNQIHSNSFIIRGKNNIYLTDLDDELQLKINLKIKCDIGYLDESLNHINGTELAFTDTKARLKLFDLKEQKVITSYSMEELFFISAPRLLKMNYLTENMLMIMTEKQLKVLDNRCKDVPHEIQMKLQDCDILLDFALNKSKHFISNEVYLSSRHAFFIYDIRGAAVNDYIHHNLKFPPCYINCFQGEDTKLVTLFGQHSGEAVLFGTESPYTLPYQLKTLEETLDQCRSLKYLPVIPNLEKRLNYPITGVQIVPHNEDVSIYFSNLFGEIFRQDVLLKSRSTNEPMEKIYEWLMEINEMDDPELNFVHLANASAAFEAEIDFNDVDLFNNYEKSNVHDFLEHEDFDFKNYNVEDFDQIWEDNNCLDMSLLESKPGKLKVEDWIKNNDFQNQNDAE